MHWIKNGKETAVNISTVIEDNEIYIVSSTVALMDDLKNYIISVKASKAKFTSRSFTLGPLQPLQFTASGALKDWIYGSTL